MPISGGNPPKLLIAPPDADFLQVYTAGQPIASLPYNVTVPVQQVGPIQILYPFDRTVILPDHGYWSFPRAAPRKPCS